jgi:hypothetical protein
MHARHEPYMQRAATGQHFQFLTLAAQQDE